MLCRPIKVRFWKFAIQKFFYILSSNSKTAKVTNYPYTSEIFASEVDHSTAEKDQDFLQSFNFEGIKKFGGNKGFPGVAFS